MSRRYALRDDQWERIKDLLPERAGQPGAQAQDNRLFVDAVLYRQADITWRSRPATSKGPTRSWLKQRLKP